MNKPKKNGKKEPTSGAGKKLLNGANGADDDGLKPYEIIVGIVVVISWIILFSCGLLIDSEPCREVIAGQSPATEARPSIIASWFVVIFSYTPTNLIILCALSGLIGAVSRIAKLHVTKEGQAKIPSDDTNRLLSGVFRGIFVYLLFLSGILIIDEAPLIEPTQVQYARLAGIMSVFCFLVSYDPSRFRTLLDSGAKRLEDMGQQEPKPGNK